MTNIHIGGSGKPCVDASTGAVKIHTSACCPTCNVCSTSKEPVAYRVDITEIDVNRCDECEDYNGQFLVPDAHCEESFTDGGASKILNVYHYQDTNYFTKVTYTIGSIAAGGPAVLASLTFTLDHGTSPVNCTAFNAVGIPLVDVSWPFAYVCDGSSAECTLTSL